MRSFERYLPVFRLIPNLATDLEYRRPDLPPRMERFFAHVTNVSTDFAPVSSFSGIRIASRVTAVSHKPRSDGE